MTDVNMKDDQEKSQATQPVTPKRGKRKRKRIMDVSPYYVMLNEETTRVAIRDLPSLNASIVSIFSKASTRFSISSEDRLYITKETVDDDGETWGFASNRNGWVFLKHTKEVSA